MTITGAWTEAEARRAASECEAAQLAARLWCEVTPHPLLDGRFEAVYDGGAMIGTADELRGSRRAQMLTWLLFLRACGREITPRKRPAAAPGRSGAGAAPPAAVVPGSTRLAVLAVGDEGSGPVPGAQQAADSCGVG